jgi:hypothetical protein
VTNEISQPRPEHKIYFRPPGESAIVAAISSAIPLPAPLPPVQAIRTACRSESGAFWSPIDEIIAPAYGGGRPVRARLVVDASATPDLMRIDFPMRRGTNVSLPVSILAETGDEIFIEADNLRFRVQKSVFKAANAKSFSNDVLWELKDFHELSSALHQVAASAGCPKGLSDRIDSLQHNILENFRVPLRRSDDLMWKCGLSCYAAADELEKLRTDEEQWCAGTVAGKR